MTTAVAEPATEALTVRRLKEEFPDAVEYAHGFRGDDSMLVDKDKIIDVLTFLKDDDELEYDYLMDLAGADHLELNPDYPERYEVVYHLLSMSRNDRIRLKVRLDEDDMEDALSSYID